MSLFVWMMMGIAIWHFAVWFPDNFWGGIVGAFVAATLGAMLFGFILAGFQVIGRHDLELTQALEAVPGAVIALVASWYYGRHREDHPRRKHRRAPHRGEARA